MNYTVYAKIKWLEKQNKVRKDLWEVVDLDPKIEPYVRLPYLEEITYLKRIYNLPDDIDPNEGNCEYQKAQDHGKLFITERDMRADDFFRFYHYLSGETSDWGAYLMPEKDYISFEDFEEKTKEYKKQQFKQFRDYVIDKYK